jgi:catecholate siderophore receptor
VNYIRGSMQYGERRNQALYLFDTIKLTEQLQINGGVRYERNVGVNSTDTYSTVTATLGAVTPGARFTSKDYLLSYRAGAVYKPQPNLSFYVAYGNSQTPSQTAVNGACTAQTCNVDPEKAANYEVGAKWDVAGRLSLTAALFRNARTNYRVPSNDPTLPDQLLQGSSRVDGVALGAAGRITDKWSVFANYTYLKSKVLQGVSDFSAAGGVTGTERDWTKGDALVQVPDHSFSLWTTYDVTPRLQVGYGVTYAGQMYLSQHFGVAAVANTPPYTGRSTIPLVQSEAYSVHRLMVGYSVTRNLDLTLNVNNVLDKEYYLRIRNNGWATPGDARQATLTANYRF